MSPDAILHRRLAALQDWVAAPNVVVLDEQPEDHLVFCLVIHHSYIGQAALQPPPD